MLRMRFMPCDFHPLLLILGNKADLRAFADLLEDFARTGGGRDLGQAGAFSEDTTVLLVALGAAQAQAEGLWRKPGGGRSDLVWTLTTEKAGEFADEVAKIAEGQSRSGSEILECEVLNEIRVKVSLGEFEDDFLLGDKW